MRQQPAAGCKPVPVAEKTSEIKGEHQAAGTARDIGNCLHLHRVHGKYEGGEKRQKPLRRNGFRFPKEEQSRKEIDQHRITKVQSDVEEVKAKEPTPEVVDKIGELQKRSDPSAKQIRPPCRPGVDRGVIDDRAVVVELKNPGKRIGIGSHNGKPKKTYLDPALRTSPRHALLSPLLNNHGGELSAHFGMKVRYLQPPISSPQVCTFRAACVKNLRRVVLWGARRCEGACRAINVGDLAEGLYRSFPFARLYLVMVIGAPIVPV